MTIAEMCAVYLACHLVSRPSHARYAPLLEHIILQSSFANKPIEAVTRTELVLLAQTWHHRPAQCRKIIGLIRQAVAWGRNTVDPSTGALYYEGDNPAIGIRTPTMRPRSETFMHAQIATLLQRLDWLTPKYRAFLAARLLAPGRIIELCRCRWEDLDPSGCWRKPTTKNGHPQKIYIPTQAMAYIQALPRIGPYVFMGYYGHHLSPAAVARHWRSIRAQIGCSNLQLLDFRRTLCTYLYRVMKVDELTAKAVLNHYDGRPVAVYVRLDYDYLATILQGYADWIWTLKPGGTHGTLTLWPELDHPPHRPAPVVELRAAPSA